MGRHAEQTYTTDLQLKRLKTPGHYSVAPCLFLRVTTPKAKAWIFRFMLDGGAHAMGLGTFPDVSLESARELAASYRKLRQQGKNPIDERKAAQAKARAEAAKMMTFRQCAETFIEDHKDGWKNAKHAAQWTATLETYAMPKLGDLPVEAIDMGLILQVLKPIWKTKTETASRVRGRIERILDWAKVRGYREGDNPARWRGSLATQLPERTKVRTIVHYPALPYGNMASFFSKLKAEPGIAAEALRFTILTASRTNEVVGALWPEVDMDKAVWTIPGARMKSKREHRVPLSKPALAVLRARHETTGGQGFIFPGRPKKHISNMAMLKVLERMGRDDVTVHGFRSTFRDWVEETTNYAGTVAEAALAHVVGDKVEAAYRRGDLFEKRRRLMNAWATYCTTPAEESKVLHMRRSVANA